jgi:AcrR family transcriptional regulator
LTGAIAEINERGVKFTMDDLAQRLSVSKRSLYEHFESKEEIIGSILDDQLADIRAQRKLILNDPKLSYQEKLHKILGVRPQSTCFFGGRFAVEVKRFMPQQWKKIEEFMSQDWSAVEKFLLHGIEKGEFRSVCIPVVEKIISGAFNELADNTFLSQHNFSLVEANAYMADILINGLVSDKRTLE